MARMVVFAANNLKIAVRLEPISGVASQVLNVGIIKDNAKHHITAKIKRQNAKQIQRRLAVVQEKLAAFAVNKLKFAVLPDQTNGAARQDLNVGKHMDNVTQLIIVKMVRQSANRKQKKLAAVMALMDASVVIKLILAANQLQINGVVKLVLNAEKQVVNVRLHTYVRTKRQNASQT